MCHREAGRAEAAEADLCTAIELDPEDPALRRAALEWGGHELGLAAAEKLASRPDLGWPTLRMAAARLLESADVAAGLRGRARKTVGWLAWKGEASLRLLIYENGEAREVELSSDDLHPLSRPGVSAADVAIERIGIEPVRLEGRTETGDWIRFRVAIPPSVVPDRRQRELRRGEGVDRLTIIAPVYEDLEATSACLDSLQAALPSLSHKIIVVDDASPNPALSAYLTEGAAQGRFELLRNTVNLGFAGSVNAALAQRNGGDVLLLNADTLIAPGSIDRLATICRSAADIGLVTPLSNNGELTSFPLPNTVNPLPTLDDVIRLDTCAENANANAIVDIPNGIGFCLYISEACLDAVGGLAEVYAQGYYEDVEFCLAAREIGFRCVAAPGVFVGHAGSKSFGARKRALVMRNLQVIEARYPGLARETAAFVIRDPLAPFRQAIEALSPPRAPVTLLVHSAADRQIGARRASELTRLDGHRRTIRVEVHGARVRLISADEGAPQSLSFDLAGDGAAAFDNYLDALKIELVEAVDVANLPEEALGALLKPAAEWTVVCSRYDAPSPAYEGVCRALPGQAICELCRTRAASPDYAPAPNARLRVGQVLRRAARIVPTDRMAEAFTRRLFGNRVAPVEPLRRQGGPAMRALRKNGRLGVLSPQAWSPIDRLLLRIARQLAARGSGGELIVFGVCVADASLLSTGTAFVTGPAAPEEFTEMAQAYGVTAILAPDRGGGFHDADVLTNALGLPKAYFDGSLGVLPADPGDLSLDPRICDEKAAARIVNWMDQDASDPS